MKNLTCLIITFLRDEYLFECVKSLRANYPDIKIIVGDQNNSDEKADFCKSNNARYIRLPFDCGLCVARNTLAKLVDTDYIMIGDDDFQYTATSNVEKMLGFLENNKNFDLIGGRITESGVLKNYQGFIEEHDGWLEYKELNLNQEYNQQNGIRYLQCDLTFNYFVARTKSVKNVLWDEEIKVAYEHSSFFLDFKRAGFKVAFTPDAIVVHKPFIQSFNRQLQNDYKHFRNRKSDKKRFFDKYKLRYVIDMNGRKDIYDGSNTGDVDFLITYFERWECLENLLFSIAKHYPSATIYIGDQSKKFVADKYFNLYKRLFEAGLQKKPTAINLPYDCGISHARNYLVSKSSGQYALILEEDFIFTDETNIEKMVDVLEGSNNIGVVGGTVKERGFEVHFEHNFEKVGRILYHREPTSEIVDCVMNFALFNREVFNDCLWDENLKIESEHTDYYLRLKSTRWEVHYLPDVKIGHEKINSREYKEMRARNEFLKIMMNKHQLDEIIYLDGYKIKYDREQDLIIKGN